MVTCKICGGSYSFLPNHLKAHGVSKEQYLISYPKSELYSKSYLKSRSDAALSQWSNWTEDEKLSRNRIVSAGNTKWWNAHTSEERSVIVKGNVWERITEERKTERSLKISNSLKNKHQTDDEFHKRMATFSVKNIKGQLPNSLKKKFVYKGVEYQVRSSYERKTVMALVDLDIRFVYEAVTFIGEDFTYLPDFLLYDLGIILEVKSSWTLKKRAERIPICKSLVESVGYEFALMLEDDVKNARDFLWQLAAKPTEETNSVSRTVRRLDSEYVSNNNLSTSALHP
jgi:hypothetical protein